MNKSILISIKPKWVAKILNGEKTIELRKTMPKCELPIDVYIYCTKGKQGIFKERHNGYILLNQNKWIQSEMNGKVVAKFTLNKVDKHHVLPTERILPFNWNVEQKLEQLCLTKEEVMAYGNGEDYQAFLWHIDNLVIFDKPKDLSEFSAFRKPYWNKKTKEFIKEEQKMFGCRIFRVSRLKPLTKAPQSWCYIHGQVIGGNPL